MRVRVRWELSKSELSYPIGRAPRTAVLVGWFRSSGGVRVFRSGWTIDAAVYAPQSIAATWSQLEELMTREIVSPERSVIVLARPGDALLSTEQRDRLWRGFHVPVFEQIIGRRGRVLAAECEAHEGLHVVGEESGAAGYTLERAACACGKKTPRIASHKSREPVRVTAAAAR